MSDLNTGSGVDYNVLDADGKIVLQRFARGTDRNLDNRFAPDYVPFLPSRGESAFLIRQGDHYGAYVIEGLGTENLVADAYQAEAPVPGSRYGVVGWNGVASIINDLITPGARPIVIGQYLAVNKEAWLKDTACVEALAQGTQDACNYAKCVWGPGELPALKGIIEPGTIDLAGFAAGRTPGLDPWWYGRLHVGDVIVLCESNGMHMNGFTAIREKVPELAGSLLPQGYSTPVPGSSGSLGDELLKQAHIYTAAVELALAEKLDVHYAAHISGHGLRKLMRAPQPYTYRVRVLPAEQPLFPFIQKMLGYDDRKMYSSYIMGAGFAFFMPEHEAIRFIELGEQAEWPYRAFIAGQVEAGPKQVIIEPLGITLPGDSMHIR